MMRRVEVNDAHSIYVLGTFYYYGTEGVQQDRGKAKELYARAAIGLNPNKNRLFFST